MHLPFNSHGILSACIIIFAVLSSNVSAQQAVLVDVVKAVPSNNNQRITLSGTLTAAKRSVLSPRVDGLISDVKVDAGSRVKKGEVLLTLDPTMAKLSLAQINANVNRANAQLAEAKRLVSEAEKLVSNKHIPQNELAIRKANLQAQKAELSAIKASQANGEETIRRHQVIAPFSGVISRKYSEQGEWVSRGNPVLELVNLEEVRLDVNVPQERFRDISNTTHVSVKADSYPDQQLAAKVQAIVPVSNAQVRAFLVRITIDNKSLSLLPGTSAVAEFTINSPDSYGYVLIPRDALLVNPDGSYNVFVIEQDKAFRRKVEVGRITTEGVNIAKGIAAGNSVVVRGNEVLHDQQAVTLHQVEDQ